MGCLLWGTDGSEPNKSASIEVPPEERTPLVDHLLRVIEELRAENRQLRDEIARLKGLPPRPTLRPSTLNDSHPDPTHKKRRRGKRPGSAKRRKTGALIIHETIPLPLEGLPEGAQQNGYEDFQADDTGARHLRSGRSAPAREVSWVGVAVTPLLA